MNILNNIRDFPGDSEVKSLPTDAEDVESIPGLGRSPGGGNGNPFPKNTGILAWKIPWTEKPSGLQSLGLQ